MSDDWGNHRPPPSENDWGRYAVIAAVLAGVVLLGYLGWGYIRDWGHCWLHHDDPECSTTSTPPRSFQPDLLQPQQARTPLPQDVREWRRAAWQRDNVLAQFKLGDLYAHDPSFQDPVEAIVWYYLALNRPDRDFQIDDPDAQEALDSLGQKADNDSRALYSTLTLDQREEARKRVIYILFCRGADGLITLGQMHRVRYENAPSQDSSRGDERRDPRGRNCRSDDRSADCGQEEQPSLQVITQNDGDALMFFEMAQIAGHPLADAWVASQKDIVKRQPNADDIEKAAWSRARNWLPEYEYYPGQTAGGILHTDECLETLPVEQARQQVHDIPLPAILQALWIVGVGLPPPDRWHPELRPRGRPGIGPRLQDLPGAVARFQELLGDDQTGILSPRQTVRLIQMAAVAGDKDSQNVLGIMYTKGVGVPKNFPRALYWFTKAADQRDAEATYNLGVLYKSGVDGVPTDEDRAARLMEDATREGFRPALSQLLYLLKNAPHEKPDHPGPGPRG